MTAPCPIIFSASGRFSGGYTRSMPEPSTAIVRPPAASAPRCAAVSIPRASPLTIVTPRAASSPASDSATSTPYAVAARAPTMASASAATLYGPRAAPPTPRIGYGSARGGRLAAHQRLRVRRRLALRVILGDAVPRLTRATLVAQIAIAE